MPGGKGGETKHDRCVEHIKAKSPNIENPHAACVAVGVRPAKWGKSVEKMDEREKDKYRERHERKHPKKFADWSNLNEKKPLGRPNYMKTIKRPLIKFFKNGQWSLNKQAQNPPSMGVMTGGAVSTGAPTTAVNTTTKDEGSKD